MNDTEYQTLLTATNNGDLENLKTFFKTNPEIVLKLAKDPALKCNTETPYNSFLILAAENGNHEVTTALLTHRDINVKALNYHYQTALSIAAINKNYDLVVEILKYQEKFKVADWHYHSGYERALEDAYQKILSEQPSYFKNYHAASDELDKLIELSAKNAALKAEMSVPYHGTFLYWAIRKKTSLALELIQNQSLDLNIRHRTVLIVAAYAGNIEVVNNLLERGDIPVNIQNNNGSTALMLAAQEGHLQVVEKLLGRGDIQVNLKNEYGFTALMLAAQKGHLQVVDRLLKHKDIEINAINNNICTALIIATQLRFTEVVAELLKHPNIDVNSKDKDGNTAFSRADHDKQYEIA